MKIEVKLEGVKYSVENFDNEKWQDALRIAKELSETKNKFKKEGSCV